MGVTAGRAFNTQLLNSDPYKHTGTGNLLEMYISRWAPGRRPHVQLHRDHSELRRKNSRACVLLQNLPFTDEQIWSDWLVYVAGDRNDD